MDFSLSHEQQALQEAVRRFCDTSCPLPERGSHGSPEQQARRWQALTEMGLPGLLVPEALGGSGCGAIETSLVAEELGRALLASPWIESAVLCGQLLTRVAEPRQLETWLRPLGTGQLRAALAWHEAGTRHWRQTALRAVRDGSDDSSWSLTGSKTTVLHGDTSDLLLVLARISGEPGEREGLGIFVLGSDHPGLRITPTATLDGHGAATVVLDGVCVADAQRLGHEVADALDAAFDATQAALCAESVGALDMLLDMTLEQLRTRQQFGRPLAAFQVLQHRVADLFIELEQTRSMAAVAAMAVQEAEATERARLVSAAKVVTDEAGRHVGEWAIQLHGAMGMTDECRVAHYVRRLLVASQRLGTTLQHLQRYASAARLETAA